MKAFVAILLTFTFMFSAVAISIDVSADEYTEYTYGKFAFELDGSNNAIITSYNNEDADAEVSIPDTVNDGTTDHTVVKIRSSFTSKEITKITIPATVTEIEDGIFDAPGITSYDVTGGTHYLADSGVLYSTGHHKLIRYPVAKDATTYQVSKDTSEICTEAFRGAAKLETVSFETGSVLLKISETAFGKCKSLASITFPASLSVIAGEAFEGCESLSSINLPDELNMIGTGAFSNCGIAGTVNIPYGVDYIGTSAFAGCEKLTGFTSDNYSYNVDDKGILYDEVNESNRKILCYPAGKTDTSYTIPEKTGISSMAFSGCKYLKNVSFPKNFTTIPEMAFYNCISLENVDLSNITIIETMGFCDCPNLKEVEFSDNLLVIGTGAFSLCGLTQVTIPASVATVEGAAFSSCESLEKVTVAESCKANFGPDVFTFDFNLKEITLNSSDVTFRPMALCIGYDSKEATVDVYVNPGFSLPSDVADEFTTLNVHKIGERPYPWENLIGVFICAMIILAILMGMRQV